MGEEFKQTEIGKIPKEWEVVRLGEVVSVLRNGLTTKQNKEKIGYPVTRIETISDETIDQSKFGYLTRVSEKEIKEYGLVKDDILFSHINSLAHIGKTAIYRGIPRTLLHGMNLLLLRPNKQKVNPVFFLMLLRFLRMKKIFANMSKKAVNQASINQTELKKLKLPLPPLPEQQKIAEILSTMDEAIEKVDSAIARTERLKKGLMQELLNGSLRVGESMSLRVRELGEFKDTEIGRIPKEWEVVRLKEVVDLLRNGLVTKQNKDEKGIPVTRIETISDERIDTQKIGYIEKISEEEISEYKLQKGDILFSHINSLAHIGKTAIYDGEPSLLLHGMNLLLLRPQRTTIEPFYLLYLLKYYRAKAIFRHMSKKAVNQASINQTELGRLRIPFPPLPEQQKIAEILSTVDKRLELLREKKEKLERIKKGLMNDLLTGKKRVVL